jgi:PAP2 superfamily
MLLSLVISVALVTPPAAEAEVPDHSTTSTSRSPNNDQAQPDQNQAEAKKPPTPPHAGIRALFSGYIEDVKHLPAVENMYLTLIGGAGAIAVHPFDQTLNAHLRSHYTLVNDIWAPAKYYGDTPEQVGLSLGTYAFGRVFDRPKVSHLGMDLIRAQLVAETLVEPLKFTTHRLRPDGSNYQSFPSGHAAVTFAAATVLERHLGWKRSALAYAIAAYVATSRLHDNVHYVSDVTFGALVGTIAGRTVTQHGRNYWTFTPVNIPGGGVATVAARQF